MQKIRQNDSKRFDQWNNKKKLIDSEQNPKIVKERDILFLSVGENVGFEQNGKGKDFLRPVLVYKKFSSSVFLGVPLTKTQKDEKFYFSFPFKGKISTAILSQIRLFDTKRVKYFRGRLGRGAFGELKKKLIELLQ